MNLSEAYKISAAATDAFDKALSNMQMLLARKKQERDERAAGFKSIITIMESELEGADAEIETLEQIIFGEVKTAAAPATASPTEFTQEDADEETRLALQDEETRLALHETKFPEAAE